jgi:hypothetical protein
VWFIAETGERNAMIVDSSALAEPVVADVLASAFDSAGRRCSAARLLYAQADTEHGPFFAPQAWVRSYMPRMFYEDLQSLISRRSHDALISQWMLKVPIVSVRERSESRLAEMELERRVMAVFIALGATALSRRCSLSAADNSSQSLARNRSARRPWRLLK